MLKSCELKWLAISINTISVIWATQSHIKPFKAIKQKKEVDFNDYGTFQIEQKNISLLNRRWIEEIDENKIQLWPFKITRPSENTPFWLFYFDNHFSPKKNATMKRNLRHHDCYKTAQQHYENLNNFEKYEKDRKTYYDKIVEIIKTEENRFFSLWSEISMDFKYAFDFVLWDNYSTKKENMFWLLIFYCKILSKRTNHPLNILTRSTFFQDESKWEEIIDKLNEHLKKYESQTLSWEDKLNEINSMLSFFKGEISTIEEKLSDIIFSLGRIRTQKHLMQDVLKELNLQTQLLKQLTDKFARAVLTMLVPL